MRWLVLIILLSSLAGAQTPQLPLVWVNNLEWVGTTTNAINFPSSATGGSWTCGITTFGPYTAGSQTSLQQALADAETCRTTNASGTTINIPPSLYSGANGLTLPQTAGDSSLNFIVLNSTTPLPTARTVCSHGIGDNVPESPQPGIRNLACNATNLSYQLGQTVTTIPPGGFMLANGTVTNTSDYNDVASMWTIECTAVNCSAISTAGIDSNGVAPHHFAILNAELRPVIGQTQPDAVVKIGQGTETLTSQLPVHIHFAYDYAHADWADAPVSGGVATGPPVGTNSLPNDFIFSGCVYCSISYSYTDQSLRPGAEGHGIGILLAQTLKFVHNWIEGNSIGALCGGFSTNISIPNFVTCQDVEDRSNRYTYPWSWMLSRQAGFLVGGVNAEVRKNAHEYKFGKRVVLDGNIFENVDNSGGQNGTNFSFKTTNNSAGITGTNYWTETDNITVTNNIGRNACNGPSLGDRSATGPSNGNGVALPTTLINYSNNLLYGNSLNNPGCGTAGPQYGIRVGATTPSTTWAVAALRDSAGLTTTLTLTSVAGATVSDFSLGDPVSVFGCTGDTSFNTSLTAVGPPALSGTLTNGLTVVYSNPGSANASTSAGCTLSNAQGMPPFITLNHNTTIVDTGDSFRNGTNTAPTNPQTLGKNLTVTNSVLIGGGVNSGYGEGNRTESKAFDPATENFNNTLIPGRDLLVTCPGHGSAGAGGAICYTEYGGPHNGVAPPVTLYLTPTAWCTGNDPTVGNCSGVLGAMSIGSFPLTISDWNQYRLCQATDAACSHKASLYAQGGIHQATDSTDLGVNVAQINTAQVLTTYTCSSSCGTPGPFLDAIQPIPPPPIPAPATGIFAEIWH